ncbi:hypothetical protein ABIA33_003691 [Streptacidiphilus sp. MAP12-16]|uniref:hypothetical protein n=1 Tax=Streptacidiphilus sp. MAP12-16 TaxID=3156300 RepID=UPI003518BDE4
MWSHVNRSLADLVAAPVAVDQLEALVRDRLQRLQYRPTILNGFVAETGLAFDAPPP